MFFPNQFEHFFYYYGNVSDIILYCNTLFTVTSDTSPMWFTSMRTVSSHMVTHIISSTLTTRVVTVTAIVMGDTDYNYRNDMLKF